MKTNNDNTTDIIESLDALRREVASLGERTTALEKTLVAKTSAPAARPEVAPKPAALDEELMMVISAAIAAFLGVKPRIRQIVLVQSNPWSQQGRVTIQASRALTIHHI